ncbi:MAG TPA: glutamate dehydrogenase, partial [bacterium]|nr:glutamate dehydrogenase [bacterium]
YCPAVVTGKPLEIGGSAGRAEATAQGIVHTIVSAAKHLNIDLKKSTVAVQGFGNVGSNSAKILYNEGCKIVGISDVTGTYTNENGFDIPAVFEYIKGKKLLSGLEKVVKCSKVDDTKKLLEMEVDILVPAALENQINSTNAKNIRAKMIAEGANGPVTPDADPILEKLGVFVIPDILCNSGGVAVSYLEWVQNRMGYYWNNEYVQNDLSKMMTGAFKSVLDTSIEHKVNMRIAAFMVAIQRVVKASELRGLYA